MHDLLFGMDFKATIWDRALQPVDWNILLNSDLEISLSFSQREKFLTCTLDSIQILWLETLDSTDSRFKLDLNSAVSTIWLETLDTNQTLT